MIHLPSNVILGDCLDRVEAASAYSQQCLGSIALLMLLSAHLCSFPEVWKWLEPFYNVPVLVNEYL